MRTQSWVVGLLTASVVALAGCSGAPDQSYLGRQALEHMSPVEKAALADKVVTLAELKQASQVFVDCVTRAGATVTPGEGSDPGYVGPSSYGLEWPSDADAVMEPKVDACRHEVNAVEDVWILQHQASEADMDAAEQKFPGCARTAGLSVPGDTDWKDAVRQAVSVLEDSGYYGHASGSPAPQAPGAVDVTALGACVDDLTKKTTGALPGLAEALATLDPSAP